MSLMQVLFGAMYGQGKIRHMPPRTGQAKKAPTGQLFEQEDEV